MLFLAGCSEAEIATITGHSLKDVRSVLDKHYFHRDTRLADAAITYQGAEKGLTFSLSVHPASFFFAGGGQKA